MSPRYWVAILLGLSSLVLLLVLFMRGENGLRLKSPPEPDVLVSTGVVAQNDNLAKILGHHLSASFVPDIQKTFGKVFDLRRLQPGHSYEITTSTDGLFQKLTYRSDPIHSFTVTRSSEGVYDAFKDEQKTVWMEKYVHGEITENMYKDLLKQGYDEIFVANLVGDLGDNIFGWRIDFFTEQRPGDKFSIYMEQEFAVGSDKPLWGGRGRILAASYMGHATRHKENMAFRYQEPGSKRANYYDQDGKAVQKVFLRAPFTHGAFRVSSGFSRNRFHPILRTYRPHHGTDYAAAKGTPVAAIGGGSVIFAGWKGGYGNCIEIRHNNTYVSRYGHLSRMVATRGRVEQGQRIGYVGATGLATGSHLHFEMLVNGVQKNFLTMNFPSASSVETKNMIEFRSIRDAHLARLNQNQAMASNGMTRQQEEN